MGLSFHGLKVYELKMNLSFHGKRWFQIRPTFMWRARQGILPTNTSLYAMKIGSRTKCEVCFGNRNLSLCQNTFYKVCLLEYAYKF